SRKKIVGESISVWDTCSDEESGARTQGPDPRSLGVRASLHCLRQRRSPPAVGVRGANAADSGGGESLSRPRRRAAGQREVGALAPVVRPHARRCGSEIDYRAAGLGRFERLCALFFAATPPVFFP